jgi:hypothetical protein
VRTGRGKKRPRWLHHAWPVGHPWGKLHPWFSLPKRVQMPDEQSVSIVQVHRTPVCVAWQIALGPHCVFDVQVTRAWPTHTSPAAHGELVVHVAQSEQCSEHVLYGVHIESGPSRRRRRSRTPQLRSRARRATPLRGYARRRARVHRGPARGGGSIDCALSMAGARAAGVGGAERDGGRLNRTHRIPTLGPRNIESPMSRATTRNIAASPRFQPPPFITCPLPSVVVDVHSPTLPAMS